MEPRFKSCRKQYKLELHKCQTKPQMNRCSKISHKNSNSRVNIWSTIYKWLPAITRTVQHLNYICKLHYKYDCKKSTQRSFHDTQEFVAIATYRLLQQEMAKQWEMIHKGTKGKMSIMICSIYKAYFTVMNQDLILNMSISSSKKVHSLHYPSNKCTYICNNYM